MQKFLRDPEEVACDMNHHLILCLLNSLSNCFGFFLPTYGEKKKKLKNVKLVKQDLMSQFSKGLWIERVRNCFLFSLKSMHKEFLPLFHKSGDSKQKMQNKKLNFLPVLN